MSTVCLDLTHLLELLDLDLDLDFDLDLALSSSSCGTSLRLMVLFLLLPLNGGSGVFSSFTARWPSFSRSSWTWRM